MGNWSTAPRLLNLSIERSTASVRTRRFYPEEESKTRMKHEKCLGTGADLDAVEKTFFALNENRKPLPSGTKQGELIRHND